MVVETPLCITMVRSGGQTGVDRGALDAARECGVPITGWCPYGGWAEDYPYNPGLLVEYPELTPTPLPDPVQRTEWNVRDSHITLILAVSDPARENGGADGETERFSPTISRGTEFTISCARAYGRPWRLVAEGDIPETHDWLLSHGRGLTVNVAGPRQSEVSAAYDMAFRVTSGLLGAKLQAQ